MKVLHLMKFILIIALGGLWLSGCGGDNKVGGLALSVTTSDPAGSTFVVSANASYTHPTVTDLVNVPITFDTVPPGLVDGFPQTILTNSSGNAGVLLTFTQTASPSTIVVTAKTGDLQDSEAVTIPATNTLTATPSVVDLTTAVSQDVTIIGGSGSALGALSGDTVNIAATVSGTTVTITKLTVATGTTVVTVTDSGSGNTVQINVTF